MKKVIMHILKKIILFLIILNSFNHCSSNYSIELAFNGKKLYSCKNSEMSALNPGNGGFRFICEDNTSVYFIYDTTDAKDGTIKYISYDAFKNSHIETTSLIPAVYSSSRGSIDCESAKLLGKKTGEPSLPIGINGFPKKGNIELDMARPCGKLSVMIGD